MKTDVVAIALGVTERRVRELAAEGKLPGTIRLGHRVWHIPAEAVFARRQAQAVEARAAMEAAEASAVIEETTTTSEDNRA